MLANLEAGQLTCPDSLPAASRAVTFGRLNLFIVRLFKVPISVAIVIPENGPYFRLKDMIYRGILPAGTRLVERELAAMLRVSRIPLREALVRLQAEGLLHGGNRRGSFVIDISPKDIEEIGSIRLLLEPAAARMAAIHRSASLVGRLKKLCYRMGKLTSADKLTELAQTDYEFHWEIVRGSQHSRLIRAYEISQIRILGRPDEAEYLKTADPRSNVEEHLQIVDTIERGDPRAAERASYHHLKVSANAFRRLMGTGRSRERPRSQKGS
jgi:DNA-binding GntR family transcriptional regulator